MFTSQATGSLTARVAVNLKAARKAAGLTQRALAIQVGVDQMLVSKWERGVNCPSDTNLGALASTLGCDVGWFYSEPTQAEAA